VIPLAMVVIDEFLEGASKMALAERLCLPETRKRPWIELALGVE
jgi:hypothetical protein